MIVPNCDYEVIDASIDDSWYHEVLFPFPSPSQLNTTFHFSNDLFARMLSDLNKPRLLPQFSINKSVSILIVCSSTSVGKLMKKQMTTAVLELGAKCTIDDSATAFTALDKCCTNDIRTLYDIVMIDNALKVSDMQACELIELLRNQPQTSNSLIITLTKSIITNTTTLTDAGADIIWSKPLAEKEVLKQKLIRLCKHIFITTL
jgi:CheY-like chemotaxis protein